MPGRATAVREHALHLPQLPRGASEDSGARYMRAHAAESPSPRRPCGSAVAEGCAEGRLGGGLVGTENSRCGVILAGGAGMPLTYSRGAPLKAHGCAGVWKNDKRCARAAGTGQRGSRVGLRRACRSTPGTCAPLVRHLCAGVLVRTALRD